MSETWCAKLHSLSLTILKLSSGLAMLNMPREADVMHSNISALHRACLISGPVSLQTLQPKPNLITLTLQPKPNLITLRESSKHSNLEHPLGNAKV